MNRIKIIVLFITIASYSFSQYTGLPNTDFDLSKVDLSKISFGLVVSPNTSWLTVKDNDLTQSGACVKLNVGISAEYQMSSILSFITGINYNHLGGYVYDNASLNNPTIKNNYKLSYVIFETPIGLRIQTGNKKKSNYFIQTGVSTNFISEATVKYIPINSSEDPIISNNLNTTNPSMVSCFIGTGGIFSISEKIRILTGVNYKLPLTDINSEIEKEIYPSCMELSIGILF